MIIVLPRQARDRHTYGESSTQKREGRVSAGKETKLAMNQTAAKLKRCGFFREKQSNSQQPATTTNSNSQQQRQRPAAASFLNCFELSSLQVLFVPSLSWQNDDRFSFSFLTTKDLRIIKSNQITSNQIKSNQIKSKHIKTNQIKSKQV